MPLYEYRCSKCNHVFEVQHEVGASPGLCPVCGGTPRRIFTSVGLIFKGSGFHTTDYRKPGAVDDSPAKDAAGKDATGKDSTRKASPGTKSAGTESGGSDSGSKDSGSSGQGTEAAAKGT